MLRCSVVLFCFLLWLCMGCLCVCVWAFPHCKENPPPRFHMGCMGSCVELSALHCIVAYRGGGRGPSCLARKPPPCIWGTWGGHGPSCIARSSIGCMRVGVVGLSALQRDPLLHGGVGMKRAACPPPSWVPGCLPVGGCTKPLYAQ